MMSDKEIIERLAEFVGLYKKKPYDCRDRSLACTYLDGHPSFSFLFRPMDDWNDWRMVEEKVMEDQTIFTGFIIQLLEERELWDLGGKIQRMGQLKAIYRADLPTRCRALISVLTP